MNKNVKMLSAVWDVDYFTFKSVDRNNLNCASINFVVEDISFSDFMTKLKHQSDDWAK